MVQETLHFRSLKLLVNDDVFSSNGTNCGPKELQQLCTKATELLGMFDLMASVDSFFFWGFPSVKLAFSPLKMGHPGKGDSYSGRVFFSRLELLYNFSSSKKMGVSLPPIIIVSVKHGCISKISEFSKYAFFHFGDAGVLSLQCASFFLFFWPWNFNRFCSTQ